MAAPLPANLLMLVQKTAVLRRNSAFLRRNNDVPPDNMHLLRPKALVHRLRSHNLRLIIKDDRERIDFLQFVRMAFGWRPDHARMAFAWPAFGEQRMAA